MTVLYANWQYTDILVAENFLTFNNNTLRSWYQHTDDNTNHTLANYTKIPHELIRQQSNRPLPGANARNANERLASRDVLPHTYHPTNREICLPVSRRSQSSEGLLSISRTHFCRQCYFGIPRAWYRPFMLTQNYCVHTSDLTLQRNTKCVNMAIQNAIPQICTWLHKNN